MNKYGFKEHEWEETLRILSRNKAIDKAILFGSRAMNTFKPMSDVDIVIYGDTLKYSDGSSLGGDFEDSDLPFMFDIINYNTIKSKELIEHIEKYGIKIYSIKSKDSEIGTIPSDAKIMDLGDCIETIIDHRGKTPKKLGSDWVLKGVPAISAKNIHGGELTDQDDIRFVTYDIYKKWMKEDVQKGDCLLVSEGATLGEYLYWDFDFPVVLSQRLFCIRTNPKILNSKYFYYYMTSSNFQKQIEGRATGTSVEGLRQTEVRKLQVPIISISKQRAIGNLLYSLDKKIVLLKKQNQTLEELAQMLFSRWFVDFEFPNEQGKPYKSSGGKMITSELGEIPEGWSVDGLTELFDFMEGPGIRNWQYTDEGTPFINIRLINDGNIDISKANYISNEEANGKYAHFHLKPRDMIVSTSGSLGKTAIVRESHLPLMLNTSVIRFRPKGYNNYPFLYQYLKSKSFETELLTLASGSVQLNFGPTHLKQIDMIIPSKEILDTFKNSCQPLYDDILSNYDQIDTLIEFRDTLLPKLMSGSLEIKSEKISYV